MAQDIIDKYNLSKYEIDRIVEMAWEDRTPFDAIEFQFGVSEQEVIRIMKDQMKLKNWKKWRARVSGRKTKHRALRKDDVNRFKSSAQKVITNNRISKKKY
ncbi:MAG: TIGR03643 family protein [bacterium]|jgi:uncharacterized protein (TIGR03643 family)|nr:TIGR03643 family protein [bacterium]